MECKLCFTPFNNTVNDPRMLSCGHTVCLSCLVRLLSDNKDPKTLKCPFDASHKPSDLPETLSSDKISTIIPVFPRNQAIAGPLQTPEGLKPKCSRKECGPASPATSFCVRCKKDLCAACVEYHSLFCPGHSTVPVSKYVPGPKEVEERAAKDSARKASYEKSVKDAEDAKKKEDEELAKKEAAEIEAINSKKLDVVAIRRAVEQQFKSGERPTKPAGGINAVNRLNAPPAAEKEKPVEKEKIVIEKEKPAEKEKPIEKEKPAMPSPSVILRSTSPGLASLKAPLDDSAKSAMPRRPAATVRSAAIGAGAGGSPAPRPSATVRMAGQARSGTDSPLPEGWTELLDKKSGKKYYYNKITKKTSWHKPSEGPAVSPGSAGSVSPPGEENAAPLPEGWTELVDKKSGKKEVHWKGWL